MNRGHTEFELCLAWLESIELIPLVNKSSDVMQVGEQDALGGEMGRTVIDLAMFLFSSRRRHTRLQGDWRRVLFRSCSDFTSTAGCAAALPPPGPNTSAAPSSSCAFHDVI